MENVQQGLAEMSEQRKEPILRLLVLSLVDSVNLFAGDVQRPKKTRVTYHSHLYQVQQLVHADGVRILNLASHGATCRHALRLTEYLVLKAYGTRKKEKA